MEELFETNDNLKNVDSSVSVDEQCNFILQLLVDGYLARKQQPLMAELLKKEGLENKKGVLYGYHVQFLQLYLLEEFKIIGLDLSKEVEKHGENFCFGKISTFEKDILNNKIQNLSFTLNIALDRLKK